MRGGNHPPDQAASDADPATPERDRHASDRDQAGSDRDHDRGSGNGGGVRAYGAARAERADATREREPTGAAPGETALGRTRAAIERDDIARARDLDAVARDEAAEARDRVAQLKERSLPREGASPRVVIEALQEHAAALRAWAAADRADAAADRAGAAADRTHAAEDRRQARIDLRRAQRDELTGVHTRGVGQAFLEQEIARARRSGEPFVLAFVDVDGLKQVNDRHGHPAGDALLRRVARALRSKVRSYDAVVRWGGDEFLCGFANTTLEAAGRRVEEVQAALQDEHLAASISFGLAELGPDDTLADLTTRGDADLYRSRRNA
jgi:diguanylate cyclase (GGDEF)-like protein